MLQSSMRRQLLFFSALGLIAAVLAITVYSAFSLNGLARSNQERSTDFFTEQLLVQLEQRLATEALEIEKRIDQVAAIAQGLADTLTGLIKADAANQLSREDWNQLVRHALAAHESPVGTYLVWEPNAVDGRDEEFAGDLRHSDVHGRFGPYWTRSLDGTLGVRPVTTEGLYDSTTNEWGLRPHEWYLCPRDRGSLCLTDPGVWDVQGTPTLMASTTTPVQVDGQFLGIAGADFSMAFAQHLAERLQASLFKGQVQLRIFSHHGFLAADTANPEQVGSHASEADGMSRRWQELKEQVQGGQQANWQQGDDLVLLVPMQLEDTGTPWAIEVRFPLQVALAEVDAQNALIQQEFNQQIVMQLVIGLITAAAALLLMAQVASYLLRPLSHLTQLAETTAADRDLTRRFQLKREDEVGRLAHALNRMQDSTQQVIAETARQIDEMDHLSENNLALIAQVDHTVANQQQQLDHAVTALQQIAAAATQVASLAASASHNSGLSSNQVSHATKAATTSVTQISQLEQQFSHTLATLQELSKANTEIVEMTATIDTISKQTNLLALNASIEAARAGEQGRGFAVVADEVQQLATRTRQATAEIDRLLEQLTRQTTTVTAAVNENQEVMAQCKAESEEFSGSLTQVEASSDQIEEASTQIAAAAEQQSCATHSLLDSFNDLSRKAKQLADQANHAKQESSKLEQAAETVKRQLAGFKFH